jgi:hypothetical protein
MRLQNWKENFQSKEPRTIGKTAQIPRLDAGVEGKGRRMDLKKYFINQISQHRGK